MGRKSKKTKVIDHDKLAINIGLTREIASLVLGDGETGWSVPEGILCPLEFYRYADTLEDIKTLYKHVGYKDEHWTRVVGCALIIVLKTSTDMRILADFKRKLSLSRALYRIQKSKMGVDG